MTALAFSADGKWLAVRREGGAVALWDSVANRSVTNLPGAGYYKALAFSPQGTLLACGNESSGRAPVVCVRDLAAQEEIARLPHTDQLVSIAFSPDARELASLDYGGTVRVWNLESKVISTSFGVESINPWPARVFYRLAYTECINAPVLAGRVHGHIHVSNLCSAVLLEDDHAWAGAGCIILSQRAAH